MNIEPGSTSELDKTASSWLNWGLAVTEAGSKEIQVGHKLEVTEATEARATHPPGDPLASGVGSAEVRVPNTLYPAHTRREIKYQVHSPLTAGSGVKTPAVDRPRQLSPQHQKSLQPGDLLLLTSAPSTSVVACNFVSGFSSIGLVDNH